MTAWFNKLRDLVWPTLEGNASEHATEENNKLKIENSKIFRRVNSLTEDCEQLKEYLKSSEQLLEKEESRRSGVETRLLSMGGLVSIAGTVVLGVLFSLADGKLFFEFKWLKGGLTLSCFYLALQLVVAIRASVRGLQSRNYSVDQPHSILPESGEKETEFLRKRIDVLLRRVTEYRDTNNKKVDQLNLAHCAMKNFLWGLLIVAFLACMPLLISVFSTLMDSMVLRVEAHTIATFLPSIGAFISVTGFLLLEIDKILVRKVIGTLMIVSGVLLLLVHVMLLKPF